MPFGKFSHAISLQPFHNIEDFKEAVHCEKFVNIKETSRKKICKNLRSVSNYIIHTGHA